MADNTLVANGGAFTGFGSVGIIKQLGLLIGLAASVAIGVSLALWGSAKDYTPLEGAFKSSEMVSVTQLLEGQGISYQLDVVSGLVLIESSKINQARLQLAAAGLLKNNSKFEQFQSEVPLGSSQFMETARYRYALEGELAKTISNISGVTSARVHLAIPQRSAFVRDQRKPTASVFIERRGGYSFEGSQVKAIENLVASSIPELSADSVTVVDQFGSLLSSRNQDSEISMASKQLEFSRELEKSMLQRINNLLVPLVGEGKFKAEVSADVDFTVQEQADELYDKSNPVIRSEQSVYEQSGGNDTVAGIPGALSNTPPPVGIAPEVATSAGAGDVQNISASATVRKQDVRNYELDRTISYTKQPTGRIKRISVAVAVDNAGENADAVWNDKDIETLTTLIKDAVGFSAERGDSVNIINRGFAKPSAMEPINIPLWEQPWILALIKPIMSGLVLLALIFGLLKPVLKRLSEVPSPVEAPLALEMSSAGRGTSVSMPMSLPAAESGYEMQLNSVKGLVAQDSERVAQVVKQWISEDQ